MIYRDRVGSVELYEIPVDYVETTSVAFVVRAGSVHESDSEAGVAHFLEHVVFRGTKDFDMKELKLMVEGVGGTLNAFTGRLSTVYYAKVPSFQAEKTLKVLSSIVGFPLLREEDVEMERRIILEEYKMSLEIPEDRLHDLALESVWGSPYGRDIIGRQETISGISASDLRRFHGEKYVANKIKIVMAGRTKEVKERLEDVAGLLQRDGNFEDPPEPEFVIPDKPASQTMRDLKHVHVLILKKTPGRTEEDFLKLLVLNTMLGSGMSSYLFEEIREKLGTVYDISTEVLALKNTGVFGIYFSTSPETLDITLGRLIGKLREFDVREYYDYGIKRYLGKMMMLLESPGGMMTYVVDRISLGCDVRDFSEYEEMIKALTVDEMRDFAEKLLSGEWAAFAVGPRGFEWDITSVNV